MRRPAECLELVADRVRVGVVGQAEHDQKEQLLELAEVDLLSLHCRHYTDGGAALFAASRLDTEESEEGRKAARRECAKGRGLRLQPCQPHATFQPSSVLLSSVLNPRH